MLNNAGVWSMCLSD